MNVFFTTALSLIISSHLLLGTTLTSKQKIASRHAHVKSGRSSLRKDDKSSLPGGEDATILAADTSGKPDKASVAMIDVNTELQRLGSKAPQLNRDALKFALTAYSHAESEGNVKKPILTVVDYSVKSNLPRMWVFDVEKDNLLYNTYVAHGKGSGTETAERFSNRDSSKESSLGTFITQDTYIGHKGLSLNLMGMDKGFNSHALSRRVVVHGAWYVEPSFIKEHGRAGNSWGCPAIGASIAKPLIHTIQGGTVLFTYAPVPDFLTHSQYLAT